MIREETGLTASNLQMCGIKGRTGGDGTRYGCCAAKQIRLQGSDPPVTRERFGGFPSGQLPGMKLASGMQSMLQLFCNDTMTELFFHVENGEWKETLK